VLNFNWSRSTGSVVDFIQLAHTRINLGLRAPFMEKTAALSVSTSRIAAPADFAAAKRLWLDGSFDNPLSPTSPDRLADLRACYSSGQQPQWYAIEGDTTGGSESLTEGEHFVFAPDPGATTYSGKLLYTRRLPALAAGGDTNIVLARYPNLYLYGALDEAGAYSDDQRSYGERFELMMAGINAQARSDAYAGATPAPLSPYAV
jgi:hypothetical protein